MIEACPRCSSRLGPPLSSGRQVCVECGWSSAPAKPKQAAAPSEKRKKTSAPQRLIVLCWRIIKRTATYLVLLVQNKVQQFKESQSRRRKQSGSLIQGLTDRLSAVEEAIPTSLEKSARSWLNLEEAFERLGGDPTDPKSLVKTLNGQASLPFSGFCQLSEKEFRAFGLESDWARRKANKPWLRQVS